MPNVVGSIENEALENEDRSTKHPNLETNDNTLFWDFSGVSGLWLFLK